MKFLNPIIDKLQALFPPNRIMLVLAGPIVAASAWISGLVTANIPGVDLPIGVIAGVIGAAVLIAITLVYKWFDQWQIGENSDYQADVEQALNEIAEAPETQDFFAALGTLQGTAESLADLRGRLERGEINEAEVRNGVASIADVVNGFLEPRLNQPVEPPAVAEPEPVA